MTEPHAFRTIGLIGKYEDPSSAEIVHCIAGCLAERGLEVLLDRSTSLITPIAGLETAERDELGKRCELAIVVGGDGTFLNSARSLADHDIALLGVNLGRLGFLTDISREDIDASLSAILDGHYCEEHRFLLQARIVRGGEVIHESVALNDVVTHREVGRMIEFETRIDGRYVKTHRSDGLIVSTPTGSTAYALSSGGPLMYPTLEAVVLVPICPHALSNRPLVVSSECNVEVVIHDSGNSASKVTCDGQVSTEVQCGDRIHIRAKERRLRLIHPADYDYFGILRAKLGWGEVF
ncbi:NAD(+) kinase [Endothiovibrio diazotrophicus]